ncbi:MAG TPA: vanadium-dependent haloperoxidase [Longimicrobiales bacterium]
MQLRPQHPSRRAMRAGGGIVLVISAACGGTSAGPGGDGTGVRPVAPEGPDAGVAVTWNELGWEVAYAEDQFLTFKGQRALALMNLAMHDALNTIDPVYERYAHDGEVREAAAGLAAAQGAHAILSSLYPAAGARLDSALAVQRGSVPEAARAAAIELGTAAAQAVLRSREGDGWDAPGTYEFVRGAGRYQTTPEWNGFVLQPGFRTARPFALGSASAFRPPPPPDLASGRYAEAWEEVKLQGMKQSAVRTPDQTAYAVWWMEFAEGSVNRLVRRMVLERGLGLWPAVRLFAHMHMALYDAYIATWDSKYEYDHWRPLTAIRSASADGNGATEPEEAWESLLPAPPFPEYVSAHAAGCAASFAVVGSAFGDDTPFVMTTITAPAEMPERSFAGFRAAAEECADSRVQLGWHFRYSTEAGLELGRRVAAHVLETQLRPTAQRARGE